MNTPDKAIMVAARGLHKQVATAAGTLDILSGIELEINAAETVAITGVSGSGKSTLLGLLAGLDLPSSGEVWLAGDRIDQFDEDGRARVRGQRTGFVFQSFQLIDSLTAIENVMLPLELADTGEPRRQAEALLARVGLGARLGHYPKQLSGGEQQRVAIARAFALSPAILFADEPTGNLDNETAGTVIDLLFELNREHGATLVLVTHDERIASRCNRALRIEAGRFAETGVSA